MSFHQECSREVYHDLWRPQTMQLELRTGEAAQEVGSVKIALTRMSAADVELRINGKLYHVPYLGTYSWNGTDLTIQRNGTVSVFVTIPEGAFATAIV